MLAAACTVGVTVVTVVVNEPANEQFIGSELPVDETAALSAVRGVSAQDVLPGDALVDAGFAG